jgi:hypothetical protein
MNEAMQVLLGVGLFMLMALLVALVGLMVRVISKLNGVYQAIDRALVPFGQSGLGHLANQGVRQASTYFDQPTDAAVIRMTDLASSAAFAVRLAQAAGVELTYERVASWGRTVFDALDHLTDGVPQASTIPEPQSEYGVSGSTVK